MLRHYFFLLGLCLMPWHLHANTLLADQFDVALSPHIENGFVSYDQIDKTQLNNLSQIIADYSLPSDNPNQQLAFYINAYNILAIKGVVDGYGPHSILSRYRFFKLNTYVVAGTKMNLDTLEHKIIRPLNEPRIHFALVCAAISCPPLQTQAYRAEKLNEQLNKQASIFINNENKNSFNVTKNETELSSIFSWFEEDFLMEAGSLSEYVSLYVKEPTIKQMLATNKPTVKFKKYDWSLNGSR